MSAAYDLSGGPPEDGSGRPPARKSAPDSAAATPLMSEDILLSVPDIGEDDDALTAALAYAKAGWFVLPVRRGQKHPGSVVGKEWPRLSSREPDQIVAWFAGEDHGIALHVGRSGAVVFDVDRADNLPEVLTTHALADLDVPFQSTRAAEPERGHYVFALPEGVVLGNGTGKLGGGWGEVRGTNGVIVVAPSEHAKPEGQYRWERTGVVPVLPRALLDALPRQTGPREGPVTNAEVVAFLDKHTSASCPGKMQGPLTKFAEEVQAGASRHDTAVSVSCWIARESAQGLFPAREAFSALRDLFLEALAKTPDNRRHGGSEFAGIVAWAIAQVEAAPTPDEEAAFWGSSAHLQHVHDFARGRLCSPWALLGVVLCRAVAAVPPHAVLPAIVGGHGSLNLFVALVGPSGAGKGAAERAGGDAFIGMDSVETAQVGSGEGIGHLYARREKGTVIRERDAVLFSIPEVDNLTALGSRQGATLLPQLRSAWSGESLGFSYADPTKRLPIDAHTYRMGLILGVQPGRASTLLDDTDGGTPQRFVWLPTLDPGAPDVTPEAPAPMQWNGEDTRPWRGDPLHKGRFVMDVVEEAAETLRAARRARLRGEGDPLDGHALLCRLKVAAALAILEGRQSVTASDWTRAEFIMRISASTRADVVKHLASQQEHANVARGKSEGARAAVAEEVVADAAARRISQKVLQRLRAAGGEQHRAEARRALASRDRDYFDDAVERLVSVGLVKVLPGERGERLELTEAGS